MFLGILLLVLQGDAKCNAESMAPAFNHGKGPIAIVPFDEKHKNAKSCAGCHTQIWNEWRDSRHSKSWSNPIFQAGLKDEANKDRCVYCHAPRVEQFAAFQNGQEEILKDGIDCLACHVRDGTAFSPRASETPAHSTSPSEFLRSPKFCVGCHQFSFEKVGDLKPEKAQATYDEWLKYKERGGEKTCIQCHMPNGSHKFLGAHDPNLLKKSIRIRAKLIGKREAKFRIESVRVGHNFPTGDVFRKITLEVSRSEEGEYSKVATFGRNFKAKKLKDGSLTLEIERHNSIEPLHPTILSVAIPRKSKYYRMVYHYMLNAFHAQVDGEGIPIIIATGQIL